MGKGFNQKENLQRRTTVLLTSKNEAGPQEDGVPTGVVEVGPRSPDRYRGGQDAYRAQLKSSVDIHIDST